MKSLWVIILFLVLPFGYISAEDLNLAQLIDIALKNNPATERVWANTKRAQASLGIAKSSRYPTVDIKGMANHGREVKYPNANETTFTNYGGELCLSYLLYDFGETSAVIRATKEALTAAQWGADFNIQKIITTVTANYYEYLNALELLQTSESSLRDMESISERAGELFKAGLRSITDKSTSQATLAEIQIQLAGYRAGVAITKGKLLSSLGLSLETELQVQKAPEVKFLAVQEKGISELIALAQVKRADLLAKKASLSEAHERESAARRAGRPKLRAIGQTGWLQYTKHHGSSYNYNVGIALDIPLFKGFEYTYQRRLAYADSEITLAELKELQEAIALEVLTYCESVKAAEESLKWSEAYLKESASTYDGSMENYKAGLQTIFDLLQAQRFLADARIKQAQAKTKWLVSLAELAFATGSIQ
jgi:outer membrane protein TolC